MKAYKHVLCATDFSASSRLALAQACDLCQRYGARLTLLHVVEYFPEDRSNDQIAPEDSDPETWRREQAMAALDDMIAALPCKEVGREVRFSCQSAKREILRCSEEHNADLIVLASHGHHGITAILGSTANAVVQNPGCDVLVVRAEE